MTVALARRSFPIPSISTLRELIRHLVTAEKQLASGPWDQWDEEVLVAYRDKAQEMLDRALFELRIQNILRDCGPYHLHLR